MAKFALGEKAFLIAHSKHANHGILPLNSIVVIAGFGMYGRDYGVSLPGNEHDPSGCDEWQLRKIPSADDSEDLGLTRLKKHVDLWTKEAKVKKPSSPKKQVS